jgi:steroid delta-isomerase-like uncharacterized protein
MRSVALVVAILVVGLCAVHAGRVSAVSAQSATPATCPATTEEENAAIARRWHEDVINGANLDVLDEITADDIVHHAGTFPDGVGRDTVKGVLGALLTGFPDVQHTIDQVITQDDFVVIRWTAHGTHSGPFQGYAPTGKPVTWTGINIFRIACGRIAEEWSEVDGLGRLQQLGVLATPTP